MSYRHPFPVMAKETAKQQTHWFGRGAIRVRGCPGSVLCMFLSPDTFYGDHWSVFQSCLCTPSAQGHCSTEGWCFILGSVSNVGMVNSGKPRSRSPFFLMVCGTSSPRGSRLSPCWQMNDNSSDSLIRDRWETSQRIKWMSRWIFQVFGLARCRLLYATCCPWIQNIHGDFWQGLCRVHPKKKKKKSFWEEGWGCWLIWELQRDGKVLGRSSEGEGGSPAKTPALTVGNESLSLQGIFGKCYKRHTSEWSEPRSEGAGVFIFPSVKGCEHPGRIQIPSSFYPTLHTGCMGSGSPRPASQQRRCSWLFQVWQVGTDVVTESDGVWARPRQGPSTLKC